MYEREAEKHTEETAGNSLDDMEKVLFLWYMHISSWNHFLMFHVCWFTSFTLTKWLSVLSQDIGRYCATVYTPTPDLSTHQEDVHRSCENDLRHRVWTQGHWGTLETVSTFTAVDSNNKSVTGRGHLKAGTQVENPYHKPIKWNFHCIPADCALSSRHQYEPLAGPGNELDMSDITADHDMKKMVMDQRSRQIRWS